MGTEASRIFFRLPCEFRIKYQKQTADGVKNGSARACDISTNGIGFLTGTPFSMGEMLAVTFRLPGSLRSFRIMTQVRHQTIRKTSPKTVYLTGIQFAPETDSRIINDIGNYIVRKTNFVGMRTVILIGAVLLALFCFARSFNVSLIHYYLGTTAGADWFHGKEGWAPLLKFYVIANFLYGTALILDGIGFAMILKHTRKIMTGLVLLTALGQLARLFIKIGFPAKDFFFQWVYAGEILLLALSVGMFLLLIRKKFAGRFDSYRQNLENHLRY